MKRRRYITVMKIARERAGMTQRDLAQRLDVAQPNVSRWEDGLKRIPAQRRAEIGAMLGVDGNRLADEADVRLD